MVSEWNQIIGTIRAIGIWDFVDIAIVAVLIYQVIKLIRETRAMQLAKGLLLLLLMYFVAYNLNMKTVRFIMQNLVVCWRWSSSFSRSCGGCWSMWPRPGSINSTSSSPRRKRTAS